MPSLTRKWLRNIRSTFLSTKWTIDKTTPILINNNNHGSSNPVTSSLSSTSSSPPSTSSASSLPLLHLVMGNEACDCDSVISSITWAWYLSRLTILHHQQTTSTSTTNTNNTPSVSSSNPDINNAKILDINSTASLVYDPTVSTSISNETSTLPDIIPNMNNTVLILPVISCYRKDWTLRREAQYLLNQYITDNYGINETIIPSLSTINSDSSSSFTSTVPSVSPSSSIDDWSSSLIFIDDVINTLFASSSSSSTTPSATNNSSEFSSSSLPFRLRITLVDHNELKGPFISYGLDKYVYEIIDHHLDTGKYPHIINDKRYIDYNSVTRSGVGSTCTLVANRLLQLRQKFITQMKNSNSSSLNLASFIIDGSLAKVLGSVIILDTIGLDPKAGRTTELDSQIIQELNTIINSEIESNSLISNEQNTKHGLDIQATFTTLMKLKTEEEFWKNLTIHQALEFDYKLFTVPITSSYLSSIHIPNDSNISSISFGTSSIMVPLTKFLSNWNANITNEMVSSDNILSIDTKRCNDLQKFLIPSSSSSTLPLSFAVILSMITEGGNIQREIAFISSYKVPYSIQITENIIQYLYPVNNTNNTNNNNNPILQLQEYRVANVPDNLYIRVFRQQNIKASRKQVVPLIMDALNIS